MTKSEFEKIREFFELNIPVQLQLKKRVDGGFEFVYQHYDEVHNDFYPEIERLVIPETKE